MALVLTGSGAAFDPAGGSRVPCPCARCRWAAAHENPRAPLRLALPDGEVLTSGSPPTVIRTGGATLLWAPGGRMPGIPSRPGPMDVVLFTPADEDRSLIGLGHTLARLRAAGTVHRGTRIVLAGLTHHHPRPDQLVPALSAWGVHRPDDGTDLEWLLPLPPLTGRTLVLGGSSSGKSAYAEALVAAEPDVVYLATGPVPHAGDREWAARVAAHQRRRPSWWKIIETPDAASSFSDPSVIMLDAVGTWLTAAMDAVGAWDKAQGWRGRLARATDYLVEAWRTRSGPLVAVSDEVGMGVIPGTPAGRMFREELGGLNARLAAESDRVVLVVAGRGTDIISP